MNDKANEEVTKLLSMTSDSVGRDILQALVQEMKLLPDLWIKLSKKKQDDVIDRLRERVRANVQMAVHSLASQGRTVVAGDLDQITIKDGVKAVVKFGPNAANLHELYEASGQAVLVIVANPEDHTGGMEDIQGETDQRGLDLGHEYDPNGDGKGMPGNDPNVVDASFTAIENKPLMSDLQKAWDDGYDAAEAGKPEGDCLQIFNTDLRKEWIKGWQAFHDEKDIPNLADDPQFEPVASKKLGSMPNEFGVYDCVADELIRWGDKKNNVTIELLELVDGKWLCATEINIGNTHNSWPLRIHHCSADSRLDALRAVRSELVKIYSRGEACGLKGKQYVDFTKFANELLNARSAGAEE